jgi:N-acetylmuramoyl-L-alanine amidase
VLTRKNDQNLGLADRAKIAKTHAAPVFLSIHLNGLNKKVQGTETFCHTVHGSPSADFCRALQKRMVTATGHSDRNAGHPGGVKRAGLGVLKPSLHHSKTACCLLEVSFMDVPAEEARLKTTTYLNKVAKAIADGIDDYVSNGRIESVVGAAMLEDGFALGGGDRGQGKHGQRRRRSRKRRASAARGRAGPGMTIRTTSTNSRMSISAKASMPMLMQGRG